MMNKGLEAILTIAASIVGLAIIAVLVSKNANTTGVIKEASSGFANIIGAAVAPVSGGGSNNLFTNPFPSGVAQ